jgi:hypothetical protein
MAVKTHQPRGAPNVSPGDAVPERVIEFRFAGRSTWPGSRLIPRTGGFTMAKVRVSTEVKAPVERVFERFTDIEHAAERVSGIKEIAVLSPGSFNLGYRWTDP